MCLVSALFYRFGTKSQEFRRTRLRKTSSSSSSIPSVRSSLHLFIFEFTEGIVKGSSLSPRLKVMLHIFLNAQVYKFVTVTVRNRRSKQARNGARPSVVDCTDCRNCSS